MPSENESTALRRALSFALACVSILIAWGVILPRLSEQPTIFAMIERNRELEIDASAKFYTESESTRHAWTRLTSTLRRYRQAFWTPAARTE